jgi:hypothetical protein
MNALEKHIKGSFEKAFTDRKLICSATAVLSREHNGRGPCQGRNQCARGCPYSAYFSSNGVTLPAAAATGNLTLQPDAIAHSLIYDDNKQRVTGVRVINAVSRKTSEYFARVVFLCASTLNSTALLLNSRSPRFPNGLGNDSGELGHNLMDHHNGGGARPAIRACQTVTIAAAAPRACTFRGFAMSVSAKPGSRAATDMRSTPTAVVGRAASTARISARTSRMRSRGQASGACTWKATAKRWRTTQTASGYRQTRPIRGAFHHPRDDGIS